MMRTLDASRWQILRRVEAPTALPYFFSGAKIAVAVAVIGAVFGEWAGLQLRPRPPDPGAPRRSSRRPGRSPRSPCSRRSRSSCSRCSRALERRVAWWGAGGPADQHDPRRTVDRARVSLEPRRWRCRRARRGARRRAAARSRRARTAGQTQPLDLALDFYVNPDHAGIYRGARPRLLPRRRARRQPPGALRPLGADQGGRRGPGRPGDLLRARGAARARPGPAGEGGRRRSSRSR